MAETLNGVQHAHNAEYERNQLKQQAFGGREGADDRDFAQQQNLQRLPYLHFEVVAQRCRQSCQALEVFQRKDEGKHLEENWNRQQTAQEGEQDDWVEERFEEESVY